MDKKDLLIKNITGKPARSAALCIFTALLSFSLFAGSVILLSLRSGLKSLEGRLGADIIVVPSSAQSKVSFKNMLLQGTSGAFYMDYENLDRTLEVEGVEKCAPQVFLSSLKADCCSVKIQVIGLDPETDFIIRPWIEQSRADELGDMDVFVGEKVTADVGESLIIYDQHCKVTGRLAPTGTGLDTAVYCTMDTMKKLLKAAEEKGISHKITSDSDDVLSAIYVKVKEGYDIQDVNSRIQGHTRNASAVKTKSMITTVSGSLSGIASAGAIMIGVVWALSFIILVIAYIMISNERKREFAVLRMLGMSKGALSRLVLSESALVSLLGGAAGIGAAAMIVFPFSTLIETKMKLPYLTPSLPATLMLGAAALAVTVAGGALASAFAARRLSRVDTGHVLRGE